MADRQAQLTTAPRLTFVLKSSSPPPTFAGRLYGMIRREGVPSTSGFSNTRQLLRHFADHGAEFGANSAAEYEARADAFLGQPKTAHVHECARKGGDTFLRKRLRAGHAERALSVYRRHGILALIVPALLPPPAPFKLFVLMAGVAEVPPGRFVVAVALARGARYTGLGLLAIWYGDAALELMRTQGRDVALVLVGLIVATAVGWWWFSRRRREEFRPELEP